MPIHDPAVRRKGKRKGRERGAWIYVTADDLAAMGFDTKGAAPWYRTWTRRKTLLVQFYSEP
jgi:hypothetical protein